MQEYVYILDISRWQLKIDWQILWDAGIRVVIIKASQGNYHTDQMVYKHVAGARAVGMIVGLYHWCDPLCGAQEQAIYFLNIAKQTGYDFLCADIEQYWASWQEWSAGNITQFLTPRVISDNGEVICNFLAGNQSKPVLIYTRQTFINSFSTPMLNWIGRYKLWLAHYQYATDPIVTCSWSEFFQKWVPPDDFKVLCPSGMNWFIHQFTGDKFNLPGVDTKVDVNRYRGTLEQFKTDLRIIEPTEQPMADIYKNNPKGVYAVTQSIDPAQLGGDFMVGYMGKALTLNPKFTDLVDAAYHAQPERKPFLALYSVSTEEQIEHYYTNYDWEWPDFEKSRIGTFLLRALYSGSVKRVIDGLILDMNETAFQGNPYAFGWWWYTAVWIAKHVYRIAGIPSLLYMDPSTAKKWPQGAQDDFPNLLAKLSNNIPWSNDPKNPWNGLLPGVGTYLDAWKNTTPQAASWSAIPYPPDSYQELLRNEVASSGLGNAPARSMVCYSTSDFTFPGTGVSHLFMWQGNLASFMGAWRPEGIWAETPTSGSSGGTPPTSGSSGGGGPVVIPSDPDQIAAIKANTLALENNTAAIKALTEVVTPIAEGIKKLRS